MSTPINGRYESGHTPEEVWKAVRTPLKGELGLAINPWLIFSYAKLDREDQIQAGTSIVGVPTKALVDVVGGISPLLKSQLPKDLNLSVADHRPQDRTRVDVLESSSHAGTVQYRVEEGRGDTGILVVEGELSIAYLGKRAEEPFIEHGIYRPSQKLIEYLPRILGAA